MGRVQTGSINIYALFTLVCGNILSIIGRLVRVLRGLGVPAYVLVYFEHLALSEGEASVG